MANITSGTPVVVRYDAAGNATGFKESTVINVSALSASSVSSVAIYAEYYTGPDGTPAFTIANLSSIGDVVIPSIAPGQVLRWDDATETWYPADAVESIPGSIPTEFSGLTDTPPYYLNGRYLQSTTNQIEYGSYGDANIDYLSGVIDNLPLSSLSDTNIVSPQQNEFLQYISGEWVNQPVSISNTADTIQIEVRNETGSLIPEGTVVYVNGVHGTSAKKLTVDIAATSVGNIEDKLLGVLPTSLANNAEGPMTILGVVPNIDTDLSGILNFREGLPLYLDPVTPGSLVSELPAKPTPIIQVGILTRKQSSNGEIFVRFLRGGILDTLYNVDTTGKTLGDVIAWDGSKFIVSAHAVSGLRDTTITSPTNNQALIWDGTTWLNRVPTLATLGDVDTGGAGGGSLLAYNNSTSSWDAIEPVTTVPLEGDQGKFVLIASGGTQYYNSNNVIWDYATNTLDVTGSVVATEFYGNGAGLSGITADWDGSHIGDATISGSLTVTGPSTVIGNMSGTGDIDIDGTLTAAAKSFLIDHPTKEGMKLQYTCLEGPENGVYCRGRVKTNIIILPDYWVGLVDEDTITVNLTPAGKKQPNLFVEDIRDNKIFLSSSESIDCFYAIFGERKDIDRLIVEF